MVNHCVQRGVRGGGLITLLAIWLVWPSSPETPEDIPKNNFRRRQQDHKSSCGKKLREIKTI